MTINSQLLLWILFLKFVKVVERAKVACYRFEGAPHAVAPALPPRKLFNTESGSVNKACKKKRCVLYWIGLLTNIHLSIVVCSMLATMVF